MNSSENTRSRTESTSSSVRLIYVFDLDDCLLKTDLLFAQWLKLLKSQTHLWIFSFFWLFKGKTLFKWKLAEYSKLDTKFLPLRQEVLEIAQQAHARGERVILASASPSPWVEAVANQLGCFSDWIGSSSTINNKGANKLKALQQKIDHGEFIYAGDSYSDLVVWQSAKAVIAVNATPHLKGQIENLHKEVRYIHDEKKPGIFLLLKAMRPHQWIKNMLIFLPALSAHKFMDADIMTEGLFAFMSFSLCASFVYVLNDLLDIDSDRKHHSKKNRPFASGQLSIQTGIALLPILLAAVIALTSLLPVAYFQYVAIYLLLNIFYSFYLKQSAIIDVLVLASMYTLRIFAGSAATKVSVSDWLLNFSMLFFFSLACVKRSTEIFRSKNKTEVAGRGYGQVDLNMLQNIGVCSGIVSIFVILMYLHSPDVSQLYSNPKHLIFATPILLFWISRLWLLTGRDLIHDDPVVFAVKDKVSWICFFLILVVLGLAI